MTTLENKIIDRVYRYETKKTVAEIILRAMAITVAGLVAAFFIWVLVTELFEQQTLDLLQIFNENWEIVRKYIGDVIYIFYQEMPKGILLVSGGLVIIFLILVTASVKNFRRIRKKTAAILKFWRQ